MDASAVEQEFASDTKKLATIVGAGILIPAGNAIAEQGKKVLEKPVAKAVAKVATTRLVQSAAATLGGTIGSFILPGIGTVLGAGLGLAISTALSYLVVDEFIPDVVDNARRAGAIPDEITGGDSQERLGKIKLSEDGILRLQQISATIRGMKEETGLTTDTFDALLEQVDELLNSEGPITREQIDNMVTTENNAIKLSNSFAAIDKNQLDAAKSLKAYIAEAAKLSKEETLIDQLILSRDGLNTQIAQLKSTGTKEGDDALLEIIGNRDALNAQIGFLQDIEALDRKKTENALNTHCLLYTSPSPREQRGSGWPSYC